MSEASTTNLDIAVERVVGFAQKFDRAHFDLACHAAFPQTLTPDLIYQIWLRFVPQAPWTAVARVLLSRLCREVGYELYEMDVAVRNLLLTELKEDEQRFGKDRLGDLAFFYTNYLEQKFGSDESQRKDLTQGQYWIPIAFTKPKQLNRELAKAIQSRLKQKNWKELFRLASFIEIFPEALVEFEAPLIIYSRGMLSFTTGDIKGAIEQFRKLKRRGRKVNIVGVTLSIPDEVGPLVEVVEKPGPKKQKVTNRTNKQRPNEPNFNKRFIFISHKHDDKFIADVFKKHFLLWNIPLEDIFQSSDYRTSTLIGEPLKPQLRETLAKAVLVLLIYTDTDRDWEFCLWECGVAMDPNDETATRIALFQSGEQLSRVFQEDVIFRLEPDDIRKFVEQFHKKEGFVFQDQPFYPNVPSDILDTRAENLYDDLADLSIPGRREERYRWDFFSLGLSRSQVENFRKIQDEQEKIDFLIHNSQVVKSFGQALLHFDYITSTRDLSFKMLIERWQKAIIERKLEDVPQGWIQGICQEMNRAIDDTPARPTWELMRSLVYAEWWFYPIVNHVRVLSNGGWEFDIYMYRFPGKLPTSV